MTILAISCEYEPKDTYTVNLTKPLKTPPSIDVYLNLYTDTISFYWESTINMKLNVGKLKVLAVKFYLDNVEVLADYNDSIYSRPLYFNEPGIHKFRITIITHTGTNSIADLIGAEGYEYESREWILVAKALNTNNNLTFNLDNNGLLFSWEKYDGLDFKEYKLKELATGNCFNVQTTTYNNTTYVGEDSYYELYVVDNENDGHLWGTCHINKCLPVLKLGNINNHVALIWNKSIFKDNFAEIQVFKGDENYHWTNIGNLSNNDTSIIVNDADSVFAQSMIFYIYCVPKTYSQLTDKYPFMSLLQYVTAALPGPKFDHDNYGLTCSGFYFDRFSSVINDNILYKYSTSIDQVNALMNYNIFCDISPSAKYLLNPHDSILDLYDLNTNTIIKSINIKSIAEGFYPGIYPKVSDNGICVFNSDNVLYVYDIINDRLIATKKMYFGGLKVSPDGQFFTINRADSLIIYHIDSSSISVTAISIKSSGSYSYDGYNFCPDHADYLYMYEPPYLYVKSCNDLSIIRSLNIGGSFFNIDFCSGKILVARNSEIWDIYDFNTGNLLQSIPSAIGTGAQNFTLLADNIIFSEGYKLYLNK